MKAASQPDPRNTIRHPSMQPGDGPEGLHGQSEAEPAAVGLAQTVSPLIARGMLLLLLGACERQDGSVPTSPRSGALENRLFDFADGAAFDQGLENVRVEVTFGTFDRLRGIPFVLIATGIVGVDSRRARVEGSVVLESGPFLIESSTFVATDHPGLQPGRRIDFDEMEIAAADGRLTLTNTRSGVTSTSAPPSKRYSFVLVLTDDQRWDTLDVMPVVLERMAARGVTFTNAVLTTPVCSPARASFHSGGYQSHNTGLLTNGLPLGGEDRFDDSRTLATTLQESGYKTGFVGKYLNFYPAMGPYVPPGWTRWVGHRWAANDWYDYSVVAGSSGAEPGTGETNFPNDYLTDYQTDAALDFIRENSNSPFFLFVNPHAPHAPATPAPGDGALFPNFVHRGRAYLEDDLSDKPQWVRDAVPFDQTTRDEFHREQLRSLQAVDRMMGALLDAIESRGRLDSTVFIFTSDNGLLWGEHGLTGKAKPYEEALRVPLVVLFPSAEPREVENLVAANLDVPATILDLAGASPETDGLTLMPLLLGEATPWRVELLIENAALERNEPLLWAGLLIERGPERWKYVEYGTGEKELYDLVGDPFEEQSVHLEFPHLVDEFGRRLAPLKGLAIVDTAAPDGVVGQDYFFALQSWGGEGARYWSIAEGLLPEGTSLDPSTGVVSGIPAEAGEWKVVLRLESDAIAAHSGVPQSFLRELDFRVLPPASTSSWK